jgi:hypothetical protein
MLSGDNVLQSPGIFAMSISFVQRSLFVLGVLAGAFGVWTLCGSIQGQPPKGEGGAEHVKAGLTKVFFGTEHCQYCHEKAPMKWPKPLLCRCTEFMIWDKQDKHQYAYKVLLEERGQQMAKILKKNVAEAAECLSCHGVVLQDKDLKDRSKEQKFREEDGVSCVVCHGPYEEWVVFHGSSLKVNTWRGGVTQKGLTRAQKEYDYGMTDLWDPVRRTQLCASCHIGNSKEGKVVTHEMYAAGHPPLPSFEVATFSDQMPRHWELLREKKSKEVQKEQGYDGSEREQTRLVLVSAVVNLQEAMGLLAGQAEECLKTPEADRGTLDLANFDCYACHHDLRSPSWRQARGYRGKPGRLPMRPWPMALVKLAVQHVGGENASSEWAEFDKNLKQLQQAFGAQPFGDNSRIAPLARGLANWAKELAVRVTAKPCGPEEAKQLLAQIPVLFKDELLDYDSAREVAWAFQIMDQELNPTPNPKVAAELEALNKQLRLKLPSGKERSITKELKDNLDALNHYDPKQFQESLIRLARDLEAAEANERFDNILPPR